MKKYFYVLITVFIANSLFVKSNASTILISSLKELAEYAVQNNNKVKLKSGVYDLRNYLNSDSIAARVEQKKYQYFNFRGNNNHFDLTGVEIIIDTELRELLNYPIHTSEIMVTGYGNILDGLKITCVGNGLSPGGATFEVVGENNTIKNFTIWVQGSYPYGYGDLFGKGGPDVIRHKKQSGFLITGSYTNVIGCKLYMRSFGHGFFIQKEAGNISFEDCYVEGEVRSTDDILKETRGPAYDVNFRTWTPNREGKYVVTPGYMKSLCEDAFRTYGQNKNIRFKNCTAKYTRGGFELRTNGGVYLENCKVIGVERGFWFGNDAVAKKCKGDAIYGPLLFMEGSNANIEIEVAPNESDRKVHALATIQGENNKITLKAAKEQLQYHSLPILIGYTHPEHGEAMSPYGLGKCSHLFFENRTSLPIIISDQASDCVIWTKGTVEDNGLNNIINNTK